MCPTNTLLFPCTLRSYYSFLTYFSTSQLPQQAPRQSHLLVLQATKGKRNRRSEEHTSELQSRQYLVCRLLLEKKNRPEPADRHLERSRLRRPHAEVGVERVRHPQALPALPALDRRHRLEVRTGCSRA